MKLSKRLAAVADKIPSGTLTVVDVGSDHCQLPIYSLEAGICQRAIAVENNTGPYLKAFEASLQAGLEKEIKVIYGDGLQPVDELADVIVIAGMGGRSILKILEDGLDKISSDCLLILQPMQEAAELRSGLPGELSEVQEDLVHENGHFFDIILCKKRSDELKISCIDNPVLAEVGPLLLENRHPMLPARISQIRKKYFAIMESLNTAGRDVEAAAIQDRLDQLEMIENEYFCPKHHSNN